jgi:uncharacterized membrane protein
MKRSWFKPLVAIAWLLLPVSAWSYWHVWDKLPARMAVHFDKNFEPNGFTSKQGSVELGLGIMAVILALFTVAALIAYAVKPNAAWPMMIVFYVVLGFIWYGNYSIVKFNMNRANRYAPVTVTLP